MDDSIPPGFTAAQRFPLLQALTGRRSRRFALGAEIPSGELAFKSRHAALGLSELEQLLLLTAASGNTGWHFAITHNPHYSPALGNYAAAAGGRTFPSAAGFHTSQLFFTDDRGVYVFETRDSPALVASGGHDTCDAQAWVDAHRPRVRKLQEGRLQLPRAEPHIEGHNLWIANAPGSTLLIPVVDVAQHTLAILCYLVQNGYGIYDDLRGVEKIAGLEKFRDLIDLENLYPLSFVEQVAVMECATEASLSCYAGALTLQAIGLGGWMFDGMFANSVLGADPAVKGLGFRYDQPPGSPFTNPTGLTGIFEGYCPPHHKDMRAAVEALATRKFGVGGPFNPDTPGAWRDSRRVRGSARVHSGEFKACVALMAQHVYDRYARFPATAPSVTCHTYLQAHHLDLEFYDQHFAPGAYLDTHARHMELWHPRTAGTEIP